MPYLIFENFKVVTVKKYLAINYSYGVTADGQSTISSMRITPFVDLFGIRENLVVSQKASEKDEKYSLVVLKTRIETCRAVNGRAASIIGRIMLENLLKPGVSNITCPLRKNQVYVVNNHTITDLFVPPTRTEQRFKISTRFLATITGLKEPTFIANYNLYTRQKRT